ncbi:hypothetical protein HYN59_11275 [Flavobacterium album]|uniref:DUF4369 domain-containing protein n=1 Tax=Flavobacterium album TaxID=2175091 RepID=A0A2S1QZI1_9FLAO|nr:hypothetical protein [Flavobacterium album]AWH85651.1 hypothetical protein HYN59_11275 [Flavobacterium album]
MKKLLLLCLLLPFMAFAEFYPGTITFTNGTTKTGLIEEPSGKLSKVIFKTSEKAKEEKFKTEEVKSFQMANADGVMEDYVTIILGNNKILNPKSFNLDSKKSVARIIKKGRITIYGVRFLKGSLSGNSMAGINNTRYQSEAYYMQRGDEDFAFAIGIWQSDLTFMTGFNLYQVVDFNFKDTCPQFVEELKKADLKNTEFERIVDIYEATCK